MDGTCLLTSVNLSLLHVLPRHRIAPYYLGQRGRLEVLLAWLLFSIVLS